MDNLFRSSGTGTITDDGTPHIEDAIEGGQVVVLAEHGFTLRTEELPLLSPRWLGRAKNISLDPAGRLKHASASAEDGARLQALMSRFAAYAAALVDDLLPAYRGKIERARTSFRPAEIEGRPASPLKDDRRLHVDAFPTTPMAGRRILRLFANVNPSEPRLWQIGEPFAAVARRFLPGVKSRPAAWNAALAMLGATKGRRTPYDDLMLGLHNGAKLDLAYQRSCPKQDVAFAPGSVWLCYTDQVMHAAIKGQYALEQTFHLPVAAMAEPERSPLRVLEAMTGRRLV